MNAHYRDYTQRSRSWLPVGSLKATNETNETRVLKSFSALFAGTCVDKLDNMHLRASSQVVVFTKWPFALCCSAPFVTERLLGILDTTPSTIEKSKMYHIDSERLLYI
jgi:hypothetical protein